MNTKITIKIGDTFEFTKLLDYEVIMPIESRSRLSNILVGIANEIYMEYQKSLPPTPPEKRSYNEVISNNNLDVVDTGFNNSLDVMATAAGIGQI